jgi:hypothetical protein
MSKGGSTNGNKLQMMKTTTRKKKDYFAKLSALLAEYPKALIVDADNVGSHQLQQVRRELRGKGVLIMGKNVRCYTLLSFLLLVVLLRCVNSDVVCVCVCARARVHADGDEEVHQGQPGL